MIEAEGLIAFIASQDLEQARAFYSDLLGLRLLSDEVQTLVYQSQGVKIRVTHVENHRPPAHTVLGWQVADLQQAIGDLAQRGVVFEHFPQTKQDPQGAATFADGTQVAWFGDPDGNLLSLTQFPAVPG